MGTVALQPQTFTAGAHSHVSPTPQPAHDSYDIPIAIVGAGFSGICMGIQLLKAGYRHFTLYEAAGEIGGTWRDNTYPGCKCDIPSVQYHFSFEPVQWKEAYAGQSDILLYLHNCVAKYGLKPHIGLNCRITSAVYNEHSASWHITTADGDSSTVNVLILAQGGLAIPSIPNIPGLDSFPGTVFHSARWNHNYDLTNKRVAVVGTGASAVQIIPSIQPLVKKLYIFQRTPNWVISQAAYVDRSRYVKIVLALLMIAVPAAAVAVLVGLLLGRLTAAAAAVSVAAVGAAAVAGSDPVWLWIGRVSTFLMNEVIIGLALTQNNRACIGELTRLAKANLKQNVPDPKLRAKLTPSYAIGCKRILVHDTYYQAVQQENVELITNAVKEVTSDGNIIAADGFSATNVDGIIFATGFDVAASLQFKTLSVQGLDGQDLNKTLATNPYGAYLGLAVPGFPNMFILLGPNTWLGHNSMIFMMECAGNLIIKLIRKLGRSGRQLRCWEVAVSAQRRFSEEARARLQGSVWLSGGCSSWYMPASKGTAGSVVTSGSFVRNGSADVINDSSEANGMAGGGSRDDASSAGVGDGTIEPGRAVVTQKGVNVKFASEAHCVMWMGSCVEYWWRTLWPRKADWKCGGFTTAARRARPAAEAPAGSIGDDVSSSRHVT